MSDKERGELDAFPFLFPFFSLFAVDTVLFSIFVQL